ncbi:hypothetical protein, partial [Pseudomonas sp. RGM 3321]|uniref:hypothetical protein n=1 Tax=Pseudomonas sp. RGM 3321 TaxID=2930089 RepID=UPI001FCB3CA3
NDELADIKLEGCIEFSVFLGHGDSSMDIVSPIKVSGVIRPAQAKSGTDTRIQAISTTVSPVRAQKAARHPNSLPINVAAGIPIDDAMGEAYCQSWPGYRGRFVRH